MHLAAIGSNALNGMAYVHNINLRNVCCDMFQVLAPV